MPNHIITADTTISSALSLGSDAGAIAHVASGVRLLSTGSAFVGSGTRQVFSIDGQVECISNTNAIVAVGDLSRVYVGRDGSANNLSLTGYAAINMSASQSAVVNEGSISGGMGIFASSQNLVISNSGTIVSRGAGDYGTYETAAIQLAAYSAGTIHIYNTGLLQGSPNTNIAAANGRANAIHQLNVNADLAVRIVNTGEMLGDVRLGVGDSNIRNSGIISGDFALGAGEDRILNSGRIDGTVDLGIGDDLYRGSSGHLSDALLGGAGFDTLYGGSDDDTIAGGEDADFVRGGKGDDILEGGSGDDVLRGNKGDDTILGGIGRDLLFGGADADSFSFSTIAEAGLGATRDVVRDFRSGEDVINLFAIDARTNLAGDQAFTFIGSAGFSGVSGQLRYAGGILSGDVNGDGAADFDLVLNGTPSLVVGDLVL